jgi:O-antigen ligase
MTIVNVNQRLLLAFIAFIALCTTGMEDVKSQKVLALMPWLCLYFFRTDALAAMREVARYCRIATIATAALLAFILTSETVHGFSGLGIKHMLASVAWFPLTTLALLIIKHRAQAQRELAIAISIALCICTVTSLIQYLFLGQDRPLSLSHNVIAGSLAWMSACTTLVLYATADPTIRRNLSRTERMVAPIAALIIVLLSNARTPLFALLVSLAIVVIALRGRVGRLVLVAVIFAVAFLLIIGNDRISHVAMEVTAYLAGDHLSSVGGRLDAWRWFSESGLQSPWFGISSEGVKTALATRGAEWSVPQSQLLSMQHLHNDVIQLTASYGVAATLAFAATLFSFLIPAFVRMRKSIRDQNPNPPYADAGIVMVVSLFICAGLTDSLTYWLTSWVAWSANLAVLVALSIHQCDAAQTSQKSN